MYQILLIVHTYFRWLVLMALVFAIYRAARGYWGRKPFGKTDNALRHWTATLGHIQLVLGVLLLIKSPFTEKLFSDFASVRQDPEGFFFGVIHASLMVVAIVLLTLGSAMAKRKPTDASKYKTMLLWFSLTLLVIFIAVPWPFSPLAQRAYIRF